MTNVTFTFTYKSPNGSGNPDNSDYTLQNWTYTGPEVLYVVVSNSDNKINGNMYYTELDVAAPPENYIVEVRAEDEPVLATILLGCLEDDHVRNITVNTPNGQTLVEGEYVSLAEAYNTESFTYNPQSRVWSTEWIDAPWTTWDEVRRVRNFLLESCDTKVKADMPDSVKQPWINYRTMLRDVTTNWEDYEPWQVKFPTAPGNNS